MILGYLVSLSDGLKRGCCEMFLVGRVRRRACKKPDSEGVAARFHSSEPGLWGEWIRGYWWLPSNQFLRNELVFFIIRLGASNRKIRPRAIGQSP